MVHIERTKLTATYLNGLAIAIFAVGALAPVFSNFYGNASNMGLGSLAIGTVICLIISLALHFVARRFLRRLEQ